jgi:8-oxo-dGTP diphosphatase
MEQTKKQVEVVAAIIKQDDLILCVQRGFNKYDYISFKYEFPGGKIEKGESKEEAIIREIKEELNLDIEIKSQFMTVNHEYPNFNLIMHSFLCTSKNVNLTLTEHVSYQWLTKDKLLHLDWAAADLPIVNKILND